MFLEEVDLLVGAAEEHRVASLEAYNCLAAARGIQELLVDEGLRSRMPPAALAHRNLSGLQRQRKNRVGHQCIMKNDVGLAEQPDRAHREEVGCARPGADEMDGAVHCTRPAATVWFVASSMRISAPVARTSS